MTHQHMAATGPGLLPSDRYRGALLGLAVGDCMGAAVEFSPPGTFEPVTDLRGGGPFGLPAGAWTDDTSMALCLAASLVENGWDPHDQMARYVRWWRDGYFSSTGRCFDIGMATRSALGRFERDPAEPFAGSTAASASGNGSLMRLAPAPLYFAADPATAIERAGDSSRTTHASPDCVDACRYFAGLLVGAVGGASKAELLSPLYTPVPGYWDAHPLAPTVRDVAAGSFARRDPPAIRGSGYVVESLEAALWAFRRGDTFGDGCLLAANLGDDADTTAAIYGQIAGAHYGVGGIPADWVSKLAMREAIESLADRLHAGRGQG